MRILVVVAVVVFSGCKCTSASPDLETTPSAEVVPPDIVYKPPNYDLGLTLNDATTDTIYIGWPVILRLQGAWLRREAGSVSFANSALALEVRASDGSLVSLPWVLQPLSTVTTLSLDSPDLEVLWTLDGPGASSLIPGSYTAGVKWADFQTDTLVFRVAMPPEPLSSTDRVARARLEADVAALRGLPTNVAVEAGLLADPDDPMLLTRRALELEDAGDLKGAMRTINQAIRVINASDNGNGIDEPPVGLIEPQRIMRRLDDRALAIIRDGGHL